MRVPSYHVKMVRCESGERLPFLIDESGMPLFDPTMFVLVNLRSRNKATNTILNALHAIRLFYIFLNLRKIRLNERLLIRKTLDLREIEALAALLRHPSRREYEVPDTSAGSPTIRTSGSIERFRKCPPVQELQLVCEEVYCYRLIVVREFLRWRISDFISRIGSPEKRDELTTELERLVTAIDSRIPTVQSSLELREGLSLTETDLLLRAVHPASADNPWRDEFCRCRNYALIAFLLERGQRRGEVLGIRLPHINFRDGCVTIARQPDSELDRRKYQPNVKTLAHFVWMTEDLQTIVDEYRKFRRQIPAARLHDFLFVARNGAPLTLSSVNKIFAVLRKRIPDLPSNLSPHTLRYTWNDRFSDEMDEKGVSDADEQDWRTEQMGWKKGSKMAARYSHRRINLKTAVA